MDCAPGAALLVAGPGKPGIASSRAAPGCGRAGKCRAAGRSASSTMRPTQSMLMPYSQRSPGSNTSGARSAARLPLDSGGSLGHAVAYLQHVAVPDLVAEPGRVGQQVAQRDRPPRRPQDRPAAAVESRVYRTFRFVERRVDRRQRVVQRQLAPVRRAAMPRPTSPPWSSTRCGTWYPSSSAGSPAVTLQADTHLQ